MWARIQRGWERAFQTRHRSRRVRVTRPAEIYGYTSWWRLTGVTFPGPWGLGKALFPQPEEPLKASARKETWSERCFRKMNLIEEGVREARKVRVRQGDCPEVTVDTESLPVTTVSSKEPSSSAAGPATTLRGHSCSKKEHRPESGWWQPGKCV